MEFNPDDYQKKECRSLLLKGEDGFCIKFTRFIEEKNTIRLYQKMFGEEVFVLKMDRQQFVDFMYKLETILDD